MSFERIVIAPVGQDTERIRSVVARARRRGFRRFALVTAGSDLVAEGEEFYERNGEDFAPRGVDGVVPTTPIRTQRVNEPSDLPRVVDELRRGQTVAVRWTQERVIPLETLVAARRVPGTLWVVTDRLGDVPGFLGALEHGADTVVVELADPADVDALELRLERRGPPLPWELVPVTRVVAVGTGDRVIVDTTSLLRAEEGILVGSAAAFLFHVASEAAGSRYTRPRPFRVNAGAAHLYTLLADGETRYLSELVPGDSVLVAAPLEAPRSVRVGRIKIERRPLVLVEAERKGRNYTTFLQEAETVRLSSETSRVATTDLARGVRVHGVALAPARHLGIAVEETIDER